MPISAEPLVRATLDALRRQVDTHLPRRRALMSFRATWQCTLTIPADPAGIPIVTDGVGEWLEERDWAKQDVVAVQLALQEALANAIRHGCRGDGSQHVRCSISYRDFEVVMVVQDSGQGFDARAIADPLDAANILKPSGRGIFLIHELMDQVEFADGGREVRMRKRKTPTISPAAW